MLILEYKNEIKNYSQSNLVNSKVVLFLSIENSNYRELYIKYITPKNDCYHLSNICFGCVKEISK